MTHLHRAMNRTTSRLDGLIPEARERAYQFIAVAADQGVPLRVTFGFRNFGTQRALWMQGREELWKVNGFRLEVGLGTLTEAQNRRVVTGAREGRSWHNWRRAFDVVPVDMADTDDLSDSDNPIWSAPYWGALGEIGKMLGLEWGGDWTKPDKPHFQYTEGVTLTDLHAAHPGGLV